MTETAEDIALANQELDLTPFTIEKTISDTSVSEIYEVRNSLGSIALAVKIAKPEPMPKAALRIEAAVTPTIGSTHVLPIISSGTINQPSTRWHGLPYVVSPYVEEGTLQDQTVDGPASARAAVNMIKDAARGLRDIHAHGYVHCDVKASNIFVAEGAGFIGDLGLAVHEGDKAGAGNPWVDKKRILGTLGYMPPEQMTAKPMTAASDVFSLGVAAVYALTGHYPWAELEDEGTTIRRRIGEVYRIVNYGEFQESIPWYVPAGVSEMLHRCLEPGRGYRPTMNEIIELNFS